MIMNFNNNWTFRKEGDSAVPVCLPHDAMILETRGRKLS